MKWYEYRFHEDYRRRGFYDIIPVLPGEMNFTYMQPGIISGLHMHKKHTDYFTVAKGSIMIRLVDGDGKEEKFVLSEHTHKTLIIPPGIWHGYKALEPSILIFYIDRKFNSDDEFRQETKAGEWEIEIR